MGDTAGAAGTEDKQGAGANGATGTDGGAGTGATGSGNNGGQSGTDTTDRGFPADTPLAQMNSEQQAAYWKHYSRQHESALKGLGLTPGKEAEELTALRKAQEDLTKAERAKLSDVERLTKELEEAATKASALELKQLQRDAADAASLPAEYREFITATDAATAKKQAEKLAAGLKANTAGSGGGNDQGYRRQGKASGSDAGKSEAERRFGKKTSATKTT